MNDILKVDAGDGYYYISVPNGTMCLVELAGKNTYNFHSAKIIRLSAKTDEELVEKLERLTTPRPKQVYKPWRNRSVDNAN